MANDKSFVTIEQRLEDPSRFLIFSLDDALVFGTPFLVGWISRQLIPGAIAGVIAYFLWKRLKGDGGLARLKAMAYWFCPAAISPYRAFPPSHIQHWRG